MGMNSKWDVTKITGSLKLKILFSYFYYKKEINTRCRKCLLASYLFQKFELGNLYTAEKEGMG